jgi:hypothetical protein
LVPIGVLVSEKKIKMLKFTDGDGRQAMDIHRMNLWIKGATKKIELFKCSSNFNVFCFSQCSLWVIDGP